jgi:preprotein translocase subunit SecG
MIFFVLLVVIACVFLGLIILVQNPKGGGLAGNVAGFSNQFMGVKQTTDVLEKGTWILAVAVALLCIFSTIFIPKNTTTQIRDVRPTTSGTPFTPPVTNQQQAPPQTQPKK